MHFFSRVLELPFKLHNKLLQFTLLKQHNYIFKRQSKNVNSNLCNQNSTNVGIIWICELFFSSAQNNYILRDSSTSLLKFANDFNIVLIELNTNKLIRCLCNLQQNRHYNFSIVVMLLSKTFVQVLSEIHDNVPKVLILFFA